MIFVINSAKRNTLVLSGRPPSNKASGNIKGLNVCLISRRVLCGLHFFFSAHTLRACVLWGGAVRPGGAHSAPLDV